MATIQNDFTGEKVRLNSYHMFGRQKENSHTYIPQKEVSGTHATIRWDGTDWLILDNSTNGTWVDERRIEKNRKKPLHGTRKISFGKSKELQWTVLDLSPPKDLLISVNDQDETIELSYFQALPNGDSPIVSVYISDKGQWVCESDEGIISLEDGAVINDSKKKWRFSKSTMIEATIESGEYELLDMQGMTFLFSVSSDEEHVSMKISRPEKSKHNPMDLGERAHHYLMLTLARQRMKDAEAGIDSLNQGWIDMDELSNMLNMDRPHLNIQIFRMRKQFVKQFPNLLHLPQVIERRVGSIRIGCPNFKIRAGDKLFDVRESIVKIVNGIE